MANKFGLDKTRGRIRYELFGDWDGITRDFAALGNTIKSAVSQAERKYAEKLVRIVKGHIQSQDLGWDRKFKPSKSGSTMVLIDTGTYYRNITTWQQNYIRYIGIKKGIRTGRSKKDLAKVASIIEFKSYHGGPYRALWGPSIKEMGGAKGLQKMVYDTLYNRLRKLDGLGGGVTK